VKVAALPSLQAKARSTPSLPSFCFHKLANRPSRLIHLEALCFHAFMNHSFRKSFIFTSIQIAGCLPPLLSDFSASPMPSVVNTLFSDICSLFSSLASLFRIPVVCFQWLAASFAQYAGVGWGTSSSRSFHQDYPHLLPLSFHSRRHYLLLAFRNRMIAYETR